MLDRKQFLIIQKLVESQIVNKQVLQKDLNLTTRQVEYNLEKINATLEANKLQPINYDGAFISVPDDAHEYLIEASGRQLDPDKYVFNKEERLDLIFLFLINGGFVGISDLCVALDVSSSTMHKDLRELKKNLSSNELDLVYKPNKGYQIFGAEENIRWNIADIVVKRVSTDNYRILNWFFDTVQGQNIRDYIKDITSKAEALQIKFVEDQKLQFIYTYIAELSRIVENPDYIPKNGIDINQLQKTKEWNLAKELLAEERINNQNSITYIAILLLCTTIGGENKLIFDNKVAEYNKEFVKEFASLSGIDSLNLTEIEKQIFTHFRSMYYRLLFNFPVNNPLAEQTKKVYSDVFVLVEKASGVLKDKIGVLPDSEVAFLTLHLLNFIFQENQSSNKKIRAAIVCQNGIATSTLLYLQLTGLFPNIDFLPPLNYEELDEEVSVVDIIFSTFYKAELFTKGKPCIIVSPVMTTNERSLLIQKVHSIISNNSTLTVDSVLNIVSRYVTDNSILNKIQTDLTSSINGKTNNKVDDNGSNSQLRLLDVISPDTIQLDISAENSVEAIKKAAQPLLETDKISKKYVEHIINDNQQNFNNFIIAPQVALPHSKPENGVKNIGLSITSLQNSCSFGKKFGGNVKYIFTLSAIDKTTHLGILKDLMTLISDNNFFELLDKGNKEAVLNYLQDKLN